VLIIQHCSLATDFKTVVLQIHFYNIETIFVIFKEASFTKIADWRPRRPPNEEMQKDVLISNFN
jgi:hypothetical protein